MPRTRSIGATADFLGTQPFMMGPEPTDAGAEKGVVVKLARWSDLSHTSLAPHPPEVTDLIVMLEAA